MLSLTFCSESEGAVLRVSENQKHNIYIYCFGINFKCSNNGFHLLSCGHTGLMDEKRIKNQFIRSCPVVFLLCPFLIR